MIDKTQESELKRIQDMAVNHAIDEMDATSELTLATKEERGDRHWLTKMATQSLTVAARIESFIMLKNREIKGEAGGENDESETMRIDRMIKSARAEVVGIVKRAKEGMPVRK
jgi:hypothetical protein